MSRIDPRRRRLPTILPFCLLLGGCMPHVLHGPRVETGTTGSVHASVGRNLAPDDRRETYIPSLYTGLRKGFVAADDRAALLVGAQASPLFLLYALDADAGARELIDVALATSYADLYVQPPGARAGPWDAGIGALASSALFAPYIQFGRLVSDVQGWYSTQMVAIAGDPLADATFWLPSIGWRDRGRPTSPSAVNIELSGAVRIRQDAEWFLSLAFTAELGLTRHAAK